MDAARRHTDSTISAMRRGLGADYASLGNRMSADLARYLEEHADADGLVPESALRGPGWARVRGSLAARASAANVSAMDAIGKQLEDIRDLTAQGAPARSPMPHPAVDRRLDLAWNSRQVESAARGAVGLTPAEAGERMLRVADMNLNGAVRQVRSAVNGAENSGRMDAMLERGGSKRWVTVQDERVRDSHAALHGVTIPVGQPFDNGLMFPGDPSGEPAEVYNCRCSLEWVDTDGTSGVFELDDQGEATKWVLEENGIEVNPDNTVTLYHATPSENVESIVENGFRPTTAPVNGGDPNKEIGPRVFFGADREWVESTWAGRSRTFEIMEVRVPVEYLQQAGPNRQEIFIEGTVRRREDGVWVPDTEPSSTAWRRRALKRWTRRR